MIPLGPRRAQPRVRVPAGSVGIGVGFVFALAVLVISVVSFPLLLDRDVDFITAMIASVRSVIANPAPMIGWAAIVVMLLVLAVLGLFVFGPDKLPKLVMDVTRTLRELRRMAQGAQRVRRADWKHSREGRSLERGD